MNGLHLLFLSLTFQSFIFRADLCLFPSCQQELGNTNLLEVDYKTDKHTEEELLTQQMHYCNRDVKLSKNKLKLLNASSFTTKTQGRKVK